FALSVTAASTAIVDGSNLTDKVWFPRALLPIVPCLANLAGLCVSIAVPAVALLLAFTLALGLALSALHVYFRDVKFLVQAGLLVWFYVTPIAYAKSMLGGLSRIVDFNPVTGIVALFQTAAVGAPAHWHRALLVSVVTTVVLGAVALEAQRRHDRLFVDLL